MQQTFFKSERRMEKPSTTENPMVFSHTFQIPWHPSFSWSKGSAQMVRGRNSFTQLFPGIKQ